MNKSEMMGQKKHFYIYIETQFQGLLYTSGAASSVVCELSSGKMCRVCIVLQFLIQ